MPKQVKLVNKILQKRANRLCHKLAEVVHGVKA